MDLKPPESISDQIYKHLFERIQHGKITAQDRLVEWRVAQDLNVSRTPVREAFLRLENEGVFERLPQGGMRVRPVTEQAVEQIFDIRALLEPYAVALACENISQEDIAQLKRLRDSAWDVINDDSPIQESRIKTILRLNNEFHDIIYLSTYNPFLIQIINNLRSIVLHMRSLGVRENKAWKKAWTEHDRLIKFLESGSSNRAADLMREHVQNAKNDVIAQADQGAQ